MPQSKPGRIRIGVGGWTYDPWNETFYPKGLPRARQLEHASRTLTSIEINSTYYRGMSPQVFQQWRDETPEDFVFAVKGSRFVTNRRVLAEAGPSMERFFTTGVTELKQKLGPINWQFAATKRFDPDDFDAFLALLPLSVEGVTLRHAVEVRHDSFRTAEFVELVRARGVAVVTAADGDFPLIADATAPFVYARIMGTREEEVSGYPDEALEAWAQRAKAWARGDAPGDLESLQPLAKAEGRDVFLYVISGFKARNPLAAVKLIEKVANGSA
jgi:uncharacterized protein YecE (DUF72 family)